ELNCAHASLRIEADARIRLSRQANRASLRWLENVSLEAAHRASSEVATLTTHSCASRAELVRSFPILLLPDQECGRRTQSGPSRPYGLCPTSYARESRRTSIP